MQRIVIQIIGRADGEPSEYDGTYVLEYDPSYWPDHEEPYDGGILCVTKDPAAAKQFPAPHEAMAYYEQSFGLREDGKPNRPLTAWNVCIEVPAITVVPG